MVFCGNWYADFPDPDNFYVFFHSDSRAVRGAHFHSAESTIDHGGRRAADIERRREIYRSLNEMVARGAAGSSSTSACSSRTNRKCAACGRRSSRPGPLQRCLDRT
jgi:hypothetical protein